MSFEYLAFMKELPRSFRQIGSVIPSSPALARAMVKPISESAKDSLSILEVGPGTGPFTRKILKLMGPKDRLVICEINPAFVQQLKNSLEKNRYYQLHKSRIEFYQGPIQELAKSGRYERFDVVVSSLPFSNFQPEMVDEILGYLEGLLKDDGSLTFCEYVGMRKLARLLPERRERARAIDRVITHWCNEVRKRSGRVRTEVSMLNVPPAKTIQFTYSNGHANGSYTNGTGHHSTNGRLNGYHS